MKLLRRNNGRLFQENMGEKASMNPDEIGVRRTDAWMNGAALALEESLVGNGRLYGEHVAWARLRNTWAEATFTSLCQEIARGLITDRQDGL